MDNEDKKTFEQLSDAEKGALLLAKHNDVDIEVFMSDTTWLPAPGAIWLPANIYRVKPISEFKCVWVNEWDKRTQGFLYYSESQAMVNHNHDGQGFAETNKYVEIAALKVAIEALTILTPCFGNHCDEYETGIAALKRLEGLV